MFAGDVKVNHVLTSYDVGHTIAVICHLPPSNKGSIRSGVELQERKRQISTSTHRAKSSPAGYILRMVYKVKKFELLNWSLTGGEAPGLRQNLRQASAYRHGHNLF